MKSPTLKTRMEAFYELVRLRGDELPSHPELMGAFNLALIRGLAAENAFERQANAKFAAEVAREGDAAQPDHPDSAEGNYFGDVIQAVAGLNDPRALPVLLDDIQTGNGAMAAVASGGAVVFARLEALSHASRVGSAVCVEVVPAWACVLAEREAALETLSIIANSKTYRNLGGALQLRLRRALRAAARPGPLSRDETPQRLRALPPDKRLRYGFDADMRVIAVRGLAGIRTAQDDAVVEDRALHDPSVSVRIAAVFGMQGWHQVALAPFFRRVLRVDPSPAVRDQARFALKALETPPPKGL